MTRKRSALPGNPGLSRHSVDRNSITKVKDPTRTKRTSRKPLLHPSTGSLNYILESDDESDVEIGRNVEIQPFSPPEHLPSISFEFVTSTPRVKPFVRPVSATTMSSQSCYSLDSAASLSLIISDISMRTVATPSIISSARATIADSEDAKVDMGGTGLAERRGFKGAPLLTRKMTKKGSFPLFSVTLSPRTPVSPPTSGFVTTMSSFWSSSPKTSVPAEAFCFPSHIQDDYNRNNPFHTVSEPYFAPHLEDTSYSWSDVQDDLNDFSVYYAIAEDKSDFFKTHSLKQQNGLLSRSPSKFKTQARTNIYDMSIYDVCPEGSVKGKSKPLLDSSVASSAPKPSPGSNWFPESAFVESPKIWLTPPSAPSSPKRYAIEDESPTIRRAEAAIPVRTPLPPMLSTERTVGEITGSPNVQRSPTFRPPGLRPLILPLHATKRDDAPVTSSVSVPDTKFTDPAVISTPISPQPNGELPTIDSPSFGSSPIATAFPKASAYPPSVPEGHSANSSLERRRSRAMVDILSLLDATALGAAEVLDAINGEYDSVDVGEVSLVGIVGTVMHAV